jgi:hypothetical protein
MDWLKRLLDKLEEVSTGSPTPVRTVGTANLIKQYCKQRYKIESCREKGIQVDPFEQKKYETLHKRIKRAGINAEQEYQRFKAEKRFMPEEESDALEVAEEIYRPSDESRVKTVFVTPKKGEEIVDRRERQVIGPDGSVETEIETTDLVAACGKKLSSKNEIAGFCDVCGKAECSEHVRYCSGYDLPCNKLLCIKDTFYFTEEDGTEKPYCAEHYNLKFYYQKSVPDSGSKSEKKPKKPEKDSG